MRTRMIFVGVLAATLAGWTAAAAQQPHGSSGTPHRSESVDAARELLGLTEEQAAAVGDEVDQYRSTLRSLGERIESLRGRREQASLAKDAAALGSLVLAEFELKSEMSRVRQAHRDRIAALLTPPQLEKLQTASAVAAMLRSSAPFLRDLGFEGEHGAGEERLEHGERLRHERGVPGGAAMRHPAPEGGQEVRHRQQ